MICTLHDDSNVWRVLWSMHSGLKELQALCQYLKPRILKPVCAVICHYDAPENPCDRFKGLFDVAAKAGGSKL